MKNQTRFGLNLLYGRFRVKLRSFLKELRRFKDTEVGSVPKIPELDSLDSSMADEERLLRTL